MKLSKLKTIIPAIGSLSIAASASAQSIVDNTSEAYKSGNYTLNGILSLGIDLTTWILGIVGSLTLVMFIYAGFTMLISAGNAQKVSQAKNILTAAVVGLAIVFCSYLIIKFVLFALGISWNGTTSA